MKGVTVEMNFKVWDDSLGFHVEVKEDGDGLDLVELSFHDPHTEKPTMFPIVDTKMARGVAEAILKVCDHIEARVKTESQS